jgi:FtsH-binding integral membrane protein
MTSRDSAHGYLAGSLRLVRFLFSFNILVVVILFLPTVMTGVVGIFIPFSHTVDLIYAIGGCLLFSGYIVYDTYMINRRLSPDEFIMGAISLYLEYVTCILHRTRGTSTDFFCILHLSFVNLAAT